MANNSTAIIGSMLLSSLMSVIIACSMNLAIHTSRDREPLKLFHRGIRNTIIGIALVVLSSSAIALIGSFFIPLRPTPELIARSPNLTDLMIAVCAGAVDSLSVFYREEIGSLVGSAIAIALVPPAAAVGISAVMMDPSLLSGTIFLLAANVIALILTGYLSARVYVIMPVFRRLLKGKGNPARSIYELSKAWFRAVTGVAGDGSLRDSLPSLARRVRSVLLLPLISSFLAFLMTTELGKLPSEVHSKLIEMISGISLLSPVKIPRWAPLLLSLAVAALFGASLFYGVRGFEGQEGQRGKGRLTEIILSSFLLWLSLGYILGIHVLSSVAMIFTLSLAFLLFISLYKPLRSWKTVMMLLIVLTLTALLMNSASIFGELSRQGLYSSGFVGLSREIISSHFGVLPEDVAVSLEGDRIRAVVRVDLVKLEELRGISGMEDLIESYLSEMTGRKVSVTVELALKPP
ncbi:MAG: DUF389 domain-containing protein [Candidatus Korarchaeota archaeon NZ13-K]|nr:MAG: DUF389 domain-containing protein [Candidatus Korarchaeota archaeon NZ13-K]